jgi:hypothetical protein
LASKFSVKWELLHQEGITHQELDWLARVLEASDQLAQEDNELVGTKTGSKEKGFNSTDKDKASMTDDGTVGM